MRELSTIQCLTTIKIKLKGFNNNPKVHITIKIDYILYIKNI